MKKIPHNNTYVRNSIMYVGLVFRVNQSSELKANCLEKPFFHQKLQNGGRSPWDLNLGPKWNAGNLSCALPTELSKKNG